MVSHFARASAYEPPLLSQKDAQCLAELRAIYASATNTLAEDSRSSSKVRAHIINDANPIAEKLSTDILRQILTKVSARSGRSGGYVIPANALKSAYERKSFGINGVIPNTYNALLSHISAMLFTIDQLINPRHY